ncbi:conserved Plasmodium protein, unknown function [Plasmodium knowlesi strain H]|uniref:Uncharacterized protein n=3 Tax=Plasmodium knowlesi TaxID=5850 RepID=A0A5K1VHB8_PLAKH|nr:conserved protein, unknown function [Plasmodium knowlesi strain H]OTN65054.1 Uncharacterized protein PKNOH_S120142500 [Plasmodium knowlesi]CAA9988282.1 conserved protein, unknown function [Plasmodium knowlesi strain H]SBO20222.1 conserved Plasmodium protein, unknown function [Plasmodium knowlesi strain H]SBO20366.1 conserved Plasmodium protein, unknown function [Plasmodium knowlesi strain H]VVS77756.1 conserved protein, unknown function [Plasmodium knowlesi strain H]|eukprot:XP_002259259.1 hypothetical protein, conserved in Plasmodium species [Plasmodium knowlesi strain H]
MFFIPVEEIFKYFPSFSKDRVKFLRRYSFLSLMLGAGAVMKSHRPDFSVRNYTPSYFYKYHLGKLKNKGVIDEEKYNKLLNAQ